MPSDYIYTSVAELQKLLMGNSSLQSQSILNNVMAETIGMSMHNAVTTQQNAQMLNSATTTSTCARILATMGAQAPPPPKPPIPPGAPADIGQLPDPSPPASPVGEPLIY